MTNLLVRDSHIALHAQLAEELEDAIARGRYKPFARLPTEQELCGAYKVSRITVRQALDHLTKKGIIARKQGKGSFVVGPAVSHDPTPLSPVVPQLHSQIGGLTTRLLTFGRRVPPEEVRAALRTGEKEVTYWDRLYIVKRLPLALARTYFWEVLEGVTREDARKHYAIELLQQRFGIRIGKADLKIRCELATKEVRDRLDLKHRAPVMIFERTSFSSEGQPVVHVKHSIRTESYELSFSVDGDVHPMRSARVDSEPR